MAQNVEINEAPALDDQTHERLESIVTSRIDAVLQERAAQPLAKDPDYIAHSKPLDVAAAVDPDRTPPPGSNKGDEESQGWGAKKRRGK